MKKIIDLHTHSTASDGSMSPRELVAHAKEKGLYALALTDHDTVDGIHEALEEAERLDIMLIPGVEIGVEFKTEMHILGYFTKDNYTNIQHLLDKTTNSRIKRNPILLKRLNDIGFDISDEEMEKLSE